MWSNTNSDTNDGKTLFKMMLLAIGMNAKIAVCAEHTRPMEL